MKKIIIAFLPAILREKEHVEAILALLNHHGASLLMDRVWEKEFSSSLPGKISFLPPEELAKQGEVILSLGGDGTILSQVSFAAENDLPLFGINFGRVGFLTAAEKENPEAALALLHDRYYKTSRMLLEASANGGAPFLALNEIAIAPEKGFRVVNLTLEADGKTLCDFRAGGVLLSTPTGSTGVTYSAGGAMVDSRLDLIGAQAISSYMSVNSREILFAPETRFCVKNARSVGTSVAVFADGKEKAILTEESVLCVQRSEKRLTLLNLDGKTNWEVFSRKYKEKGDPQ